VLTVDLAAAKVAIGTRVLDLGCGGGRHTFASLKQGALVVSVDAKLAEVAATAAIAAAMDEQGELPERARSSVLAADILRLPFDTETFDRVIASEVLEHIVDDEAALCEISRVLRPKGIVALSVPRALPERANWLLSSAYHEVEGGHVRIYRRRTLVERCQRAGLRVIGSHHAHALHSPYWWLKCAVGVEHDDHPLVRAYHRLLVWDITRRPAVLRAFERLLNPIIGKSLVIYLERST
jgi:SAM-dependent methyltransferase